MICVSFLITVMQITGLLMYRTCGVRLNSQTYNSLVLDKSLFYSLPVLQCILLYLFTQKTYFTITRVSDYNLHNLVILAESYEDSHAVMTLPFPNNLPECHL